MSAFFGTAPSTITIPFTVPAVAVSTFCPAPAPLGDDAGDDELDVPELEPPPHATAMATLKPRAQTHTFRRRIDLS